jgi:hypothetical protein
MEVRATLRGIIPGASAPTIAGVADVPIGDRRR